MKTKITFLALFFVSTFISGQTINQLGYYSVNGLFGLDTKDEYMVLSNGHIVDNSDPGNPILAGQYSFTGDGSCVLVMEEYAYFGTGMSGDLFIADISNITFPIHVGSLDLAIGNGVFGLALTGNTLLAALGMNGTLLSIDISDKANPVPLDTLYLPGGQCRDVALRGSYAYAAHENGLKVIDISDSENLELVTSVGSGYNSVDVSENHVFLGKSSGGIDVYNLMGPANPDPAFSITNTGGTAWDLKYHESLLYLATNSNGLFIYKTEENSASEVGNFPNTGNGQSFGVCLQDSLILLTGLINGVAILHYDSTGNVGTNPLPLTGRISIQPNPATDYIDIEYKLEDAGSIEILDLNGAVVYISELKPPSKRLDISGLSAGQYILNIETRRGISSGRFIKAD